MTAQPANGYGCVATLDFFFFKSNLINYNLEKLNKATIRIERSLMLLRTYHYSVQIEKINQTELI